MSYQHAYLLFKLVNILSWTQPYLDSRFYVQSVIVYIIFKAGLKYSYARVFLKCKTDSILPMTSGNLRENEKTLSWNITNYIWHSLIHKIVLGRL